MKCCDTSSTRVGRRNFALLAFGVLVVAGILCFMSSAPRRTKDPAVNQCLRTELQLRDGSLLNGGVPFTGAVVERYGNGQMKSRSSVSNGLLEGLSEGWHTNGVLQVSEHFTKGVSHGLRTKYYGSGRKLSEADVLNGTIEGIYQTWHENGNLAQRVCLSNGVPDGEAASYFLNGSLKARVRLDHGKVINQYFAERGQGP